MKDDSYWNSKENSLELIELSSIKNQYQPTISKNIVQNIIQR
jgi:hypothetical protein